MSKNSSCGKPCETCEHLDRCGGEITDDTEIRTCDECCSHFDNLNQCCWQAGEWGLCFTVYDGDTCHLGYKGDG